MCNFKTRLEARGHPKSLIERMVSEVSFAGRHSALKKQTKQTKGKFMTFVTTYHPGVKNLKHCYKNGVSSATLPKRLQSFESEIALAWSKCALPPKCTICYCPGLLLPCPPAHTHTQDNQVLLLIHFCVCLLLFFSYIQFTGILSMAVSKMQLALVTPMLYVYWDFS